jgi:hypothetical protein
VLVVRRGPSPRGGLALPRDSSPAELRPRNPSERGPRGAEPAGRVLLGELSPPRAGAARRVWSPDAVRAEEEEEVRLDEVRGAQRALSAVGVRGPRRGPSAEELRGAEPRGAPPRLVRPSWPAPPAAGLPRPWPAEPKPADPLAPPVRPALPRVMPERPLAEPEVRGLVVRELGDLVAREPPPPARPPLVPRPCGDPVPSATLTNLHLHDTQTNEEGRSTITGATLFKYVRRRPTLPHGPPCSTIGAEGLNFRVRNGTGCFPHAITAETLLRCHRPRWACIRPHLGNRTVDAKQEYEVEAKPLGLLVPVSYTRCRASTSGLSTQSSTGGLTWLTQRETSS